MEKDKKASVAESMLNEPQPAKVWIVQGVLGGIKSLGLWIFDLLSSVVLTLINLFIILGKSIYKFVIGIGHFFKEIYRKFRYNDISGRLSFIIFGSSSFAHGQAINGVLYIVYEIAYLVLLAVFGFPAIAKLSNLGTVPYIEQTVCDEDGFCAPEKVTVDNSVLILIYGILWLLTIIVFLYIWKRSIDSGYNNYRIVNFEKFRDRLETVEPLSKQIDEDMSENKLYSNSFSLLKARYSKVYEEANRLAGDDKMSKDYFALILNETILANKRYYKEKSAWDAKVAKKKAIYEKALNDEASKARIAALQKKADISLEAYEKADDLLNEAKSKKLEGQAYDDAVKARHDAKELAIKDGNAAADFAQKVSAKNDKLYLKYQDVNKLAVEYSKKYLCFGSATNFRNHSKYGKFNIYYKKKKAYSDQIKFLQQYQNILEAFEKGYATYEEANKANVQAKADLKKSLDEKCAAINAECDAMLERRHGIEAKRGIEKEAYEARIQQLNSSVSDPVALKSALADAKFIYRDHLITIGGILDSVPTEKDIKALRKDKLNEVINAFKRDDKALKTDYTAETYAEYMASSYMIVNLELEYKDALSKIAEVKKKMDDATIKASIAALQKAENEYDKKNPTHFDGQPKTFKNQLRSLIDENFHITLLALPLLGIVFFTIMPLILSICVAFTNYKYGHVPPTQLFTWVGFENFANLFSPDPASIYAGLSEGLGQTIGWTFIWAILATFTNYILGIIVALLINKDGIKFKKFWRQIFVLSIAVPQFISLIGMSLLLKDEGAFGQFWLEIFGTKLGFGTSKVNGALTSKIIIILVNIWIGIPYTILSVSGILMNIPRDLYESSTIDGAGPATQFFKITMPYILFVTGPKLITDFIGNINNFGVIYFLTGGGPDNITELSLGHTDLLITWLYKLTTNANNPQYGLAAAIGLIVFFICGFFSIIMYNKSGAVTSEDQFQ